MTRPSACPGRNHLKHVRPPAEEIVMATNVFRCAVGRRIAMLGTLVAAALLAWTASARAAVMTFGSPLAVPATKDTASHLGYAGSDVLLPGSIFHVPHDGADTALWNGSSPVGSQAAPASGQVLSLRLEGCARQPPGTPAPLTEIHFQDLV